MTIDSPPPSPPNPGITDDLNADEVLKSYRYVRVGLVALVCFLFVAVAIEVATAGGCFRDSLSSYYYTPARAVFTGSLIAMAASLIALRGEKIGEDMFLNFAGMFALIVALVPCGQPLDGDMDYGCRSFPIDFASTPFNVRNNILALLIVGLVVLVLTGVAIIRKQGGRWPTSWIAGYVLAVLLYLGFLIWFVMYWAAIVSAYSAVSSGAAVGSSFVPWAHNIAAGGLFVSIAIVVFFNIIRSGELDNNAPLAAYKGIFWAMLGFAVLMVGVRLTLNWEYWLLVLEVGEIALFGAFWGIQSKECWAGQSPTAPGPPGPADGAIDSLDSFNTSDAPGAVVAGAEQ